MRLAAAVGCLACASALSAQQNFDSVRVRVSQGAPGIRDAMADAWSRGFVRRKVFVESVYRSLRPGR